MSYALCVMQESMLRLLSRLKPTLQRHDIGRKVRL